MNTPTAYARRARAARDAARTIAASSRHFTRADDERAARLVDYADRCATLAYRAAGWTSVRPVDQAMDHTVDTRTAWLTIRHDRERLAGLRGLRGGGWVAEADRVPMHEQL